MKRRVRHADGRQRARSGENGRSKPRRKMASELPIEPSGKVVSGVPVNALVYRSPESYMKGGLLGRRTRVVPRESSSLSNQDEDFFIGERRSPYEN